MKIPRDPPSTKEILASIGSERVMELLDREDVAKFIEHTNEKYLYWDEIIFRPGPKDLSMEQLWALVKYTRRLNEKSISLFDDPGLKFRYMMNNIILERLHFFDLNMSGSVRERGTIPENDSERYLIGSLMEEAIASSQLEGAATTREVAKDMLRTEREPTSVSERMISNNYLTIKMILDLKDDDLTSEMILEIHDSMTSGTLENGRFEGRYRDNNEIVVMDNTTGEVVHCPPDHERLSELIRDLCLFVNTRHDGKEGRDFIHPIIKASIIHFLIGYLHPFEDGNGRCARALFYWFMLKSDYRLMEYMSISRTIKASPSGYARAYLFSEKDENDIGYFIMFKTRVIEKALDDLISYIERNTTRKNNIPFSTALAKCGFNNRQAYILEKMKENENRTFTIKEVRNIFNVVHQTARTDLQDLIDRKLIEREQAGRRFIYFTSGKFKKKLECYLNK